MQNTLGIMAMLINFIGYIPYVRDIFRNKAKPHRISWGIWLILTSIGAFNQVLNGGGSSSLFLISSAFLVAFVFFLSFRKGMGGASFVDRVCLVLAIILLIYWLGLHETRLSTIFAVVIDCIAAIPTMIKTYKHPHTETYSQWILASIASFLTLLSVPRFDIILLIYPFSIMTIDGSIAIIKYIRER